MYIYVDNEKAKEEQTGGPPRPEDYEVPVCWKFSSSSSLGVGEAGLF